MEGGPEQRGPPRPEAIPGTSTGVADKTGPPQSVKKEDNTIEKLAQRVSLTLSRPTPIKEMVQITVNTVNYEPYFRAMYNQYFSTLFPGQIVVDDIITEDDFVFVLRRVLMARLQYVHSQTISPRLVIPLGMYNDMILPYAAAQPFELIGSCTIRNGGTIIHPTYQAERANNILLTDAVNRPMVERFNRFITTLSTRNIIRVRRMSKSAEGTSWFILGAYNNADVANESDEVQVRSAWKEVDEFDIFLASIIQNGMNGLIPDHHGTIMHSSRYITGVLSIRNQYFERA